MGAQSGHTIAIKQSGLSTAMANEACTSISASVYQITSTTKRVIDPAVAITVTDNGATQADTSYTVNYLFGKVTKGSGSFTGPVTVSANYLPMLDEALVRSATLSFAASLADITTMATGTTNRERLHLLRDFSGTMEGFDVLRTDIDPGAGVVSPYADFLAGTTRVLEVAFASGVIFRSFIKFSAAKNEVDVSAELKSSLEFSATARTGTDQTEGQAFAWSTD